MSANEGCSASNGRMTMPDECFRSSEYSDQGDCFFHDLLDRWYRACCHEEKNGNVDLRLCGQHLLLRFSSSRLQLPLTRAFRHCIIPTIPSTKPDFVIHIFDGESGVSLPDSPWLRPDFQRRGEINSRLSDDIIASFLMGPDILNIYHQRLKQAVYWIRDGRQIPFYEQAAPFRHLLHWWLREKGWLLVHGAGIGDQNDRGILLAGKGGSGKSTLAVAAAMSGTMKFCGDDYCAINTSPPFRLASIYPTAKLTEKTMEMLSLSPSDGMLRGEEKQVFFMGEIMEKQIAESLALKGFVVPGRQPALSHPDLQPLTSGAVARHLAVSSLYQMPHAGAAEFTRLAEISRSIPGWSLTMPPGNPASAIPILREMLSHVC